MKTRPELLEMYRHAQGSVAFVDESFDLRHGRRRFYLLSAVVVPARSARNRSGKLHRDHPDRIHAAELRAEGRLDDLAEVTSTAAQLHDTAHVFVAEVPDGDRSGRRTRARLVEELATRLSADHDVGTFVLDSRVLADADSADWRVFRRMRAVGLVDRRLNAVHSRPSREKLLQAADLLAYAYRQKIAWGNSALLDLYPPDRFVEHQVPMTTREHERADAAARADAARRVAAQGIAKLAAARQPVPVGAAQGRVPAGAPGGAGGQFASKVNSAPSRSLS